MKIFLYRFLKSTGLFVISTLLLLSCNKWIDTKINIDPDSPADVSMNLMLPPIQQAMGYNLAGNDMVLTTNIWMQQFDGVDRQAYTCLLYTSPSPRDGLLS